MSDPSTNLHYAPNGNFTNSPYDPGVAGFNLADVSSKANLDALPAGVKGMVYLGYTGGDTTTFENMIKPYLGDSKVYGFYLADEPDPNVVPAANLKAESDAVHNEFGTGTKTFIVEYNDGTPTVPSYGYSPANTDIDLFGLDPYPIRPASEGTEFKHGYDLAVINDAVKEAEAIGVPKADIVPVYQTFGGGGYSSYTLPRPDQLVQDLQTWGKLTPHPGFDYAYSWGTQLSDTALVNDPGLQAIMAMHNTGTSTMAATDTGGTSKLVAAISSGSGNTTVGSGSVSQNVSGGVDTWSFSSITSETIGLGPGTLSMSFVNPGALTLAADAGNDTVTANSGTNTFSAGSGTLDVTGGSGTNSYWFHTQDAALTIHDFKNNVDQLSVDFSLKAKMVETADGHGGSLLTFGAGHTTDIANIASFNTAQIHFV